MMGQEVRVVYTVDAKSPTTLLADITPGQVNKSPVNDANPIKVTNINNEKHPLEELLIFETNKKDIN
jgi:hypothetical protein